MSKDLTIFIRSYNESIWIERCLEAVFSQKTDRTYSVLLLDSGSTDDTIEKACRFPVTVLAIEKGSFTYSGALNLGVEHSLSPLVIFLSAHAIPANNRWLAELVLPFDDSTVIGSFSRQLPWPEAHSRVQRVIHREFPPEPATTTASDLKAAAAHGIEPYVVARFSNASSAVRRDFVLRNPFRALPFAEDRFFASEVLLADGTIAYASKSGVFHSHEPDFAASRKVARAATISRYQINSFVAEELHAAAVTVERATIFKASVKFAALLLFILFKLSILLLLLFRRESAPEARFWIGELGISLGKLDGFRILRRMQPLVTPEFAPLPGKVGEIKRHG